MALTNNRINTVLQQGFVAADFVAGLNFLAFNINNSGGNIVLLDGFEAACAATGADFNNLQFVQVEIYEGVQFNATTPVLIQAATRSDLIFSTFTDVLLSRCFTRWFTQPIVTLKDKQYGIYTNFLFSVNPALVNCRFAVYGRYVPAGKKAEYFKDPR